MSGRRHTILVVEDDTAVREAFRLALTTAGFDVREAADGLQAMRRLDDGNADLIVLDIGLPGVDGYDVIAELAKDPSYRSIPVVVVTGRFEMRLQQLKVACIARKPIDPDELVALVRRCLPGAPSARNP